MDATKIIPRIQDIVPDLSKMEPLYGSWLIDSFIPEGSLVMISGPPGGGKSTIALAMAGAVSSGGSFAGYTTKRAPVLYLDRENPQIIAQSKVRQQEVVTDDHFLYWGNWVNWVNAQGVKGLVPTFNDPLVKKYVQDAPVKPLIVVDSMTAFYGGDENDSVKIRAFFKPARDLADEGATVLFIHHSGKAESAQEYRGSSDIPAALDVGFFAKKINKAQMLEEMLVRPFKTRFIVSDEITFNYEQGVFSEKTMTSEEKSKAKMKGGAIHATEQAIYSQSRKHGV